MTTEASSQGGYYVAITAIALVLVVYLSALLIGFLVKLLFVTAAVVLALLTWRIWRRGS